jgi:hypothetical protein
MRKEDFDQFSVLMLTLSELYDKKVSEPVLKMYFIALEQFPIEQVQRAVNRAVTELKFFPKPAELIELMAGNRDDRAESAWETLWQAYLKAGYWDSVIFEDLIITATVLNVFGGWVAMSAMLKELSPEMIQAKRKEFVASYRREANKPAKYEFKHLPGYHEINNAESVSQWTRDRFADTYTQRMYVASAKGGRFVDARFDRATARLIDTEQTLLANAAVPALPMKPRLELMPAPSEEAQRMSPDEIKAGIESLKDAMTGRIN